MRLENIKLVLESYGVVMVELLGLEHQPIVSSQRGGFLHTQKAYLTRLQLQQAFR